MLTSLADRRFFHRWLAPSAGREFRGGKAMARLSDLPPAQAKRVAEFECPEFARRRWVSGPPLAVRRVAIVSSAGFAGKSRLPANQTPSTE
jgi:hypothetical protein